jgi:hypothetical protein
MSRFAAARVFAALTFLTLGIGQSEGAIIITAGPGGGNPAENVVFNQSGLVTNGTPVQGATNQTSVVLDIQPNQSITLLASGGQGQAHVQQFGGGGFDGVSFIPHSANNLPAGLFPLSAFNDFKFNVNALANGTIDIVVNGKDGSNNAVTSSLLGASLSQNGENFFRIIADNNFSITNVTITASGNIIDDLKQVRLGGLTGPAGIINPPPSPDPDFVPEPASAVLWGLLAAAGAVARWRKNRHSKC